MITLEEFRKVARCGYCKKSLADSRAPPMVLLNNRAQWGIPTRRIPGTMDNLRAIGALCDNCIKEKRTPLEAIEITGELDNKIIYHEMEVVDGTKEKGAEKG